MARVLVIGGTLFIGRALVDQLLDRGDEVVIMHRGNGTPFGSRVGEITVRADRVRSELGLELTPLEDGLRETYRWYQQQQRPHPDFSWEDRLLVSAR